MVFGCMAMMTAPCLAKCKWAVRLPVPLPPHARPRGLPAAHRKRCTQHREDQACPPNPATPRSRSLTSFQCCSSIAALASLSGWLSSTDRALEHAAARARARTRTGGVELHESTRHAQPAAQQQACAMCVHWREGGGTRGARDCPAAGMLDMTAVCLVSPAQNYYPQTPRNPWPHH